MVRLVLARRAAGSARDSSGAFGEDCTPDHGDRAGVASASLTVNPANPSAHAH